MNNIEHRLSVKCYLN